MIMFVGVAVERRAPVGAGEPTPPTPQVEGAHGCAAWHIAPWASSGQLRQWGRAVWLAASTAFERQQSGGSAASASDLLELPTRRFFLFFFWHRWRLSSGTMIHRHRGVFGAWPAVDSRDGISEGGVAIPRLSRRARRASAVVSHADHPRPTPSWR